MKTSNNINIYNNIKSINNVYNSNPNTISHNLNNNLTNSINSMKDRTNNINISNLQNINPNNNFNAIEHKSLSSFNSNKFANLNLEELENKNFQMLQLISSQDNIIRQNSQNHVNSICELVKNEISTIQQYKQEQLDIITYINAMQNILNCQANQIAELNLQFDRLKYMVGQQTKVGQLINAIKEERNNSQEYNNLSGLLEDTELFKNEDQNERNLRNLQNIQNQINNDMNSNMDTFDLMG